jgi:hypothetical protein
MKLILLFYTLYLLLINKVLSDSLINTQKIYINNEYYSIAKLNEPCVVDNSTLNLNKNISPIERGVGKNNCETGLTCFEFKCVFPSKVGDPCSPYYFTASTFVYDSSNCTNEFYCDDNLTCQKTKKIRSLCKSSAECINNNIPTVICEENKCVQSREVNASSSERYFFVFFFMTILIYIYYRQYTIQEAQLSRLNEIAPENNMSETRRDPDLETLPPYSPPSSTFLNDDDNCSHCSNVPTLREPPSYHRFPTVNIQMSSINRANSESSASSNNDNNNNNNSNSLYPIVINNNLNSNFDQTRLSLHRSSQYSLRSSQIPSTPPPSYSHPTTPYQYNIESLDDENESDIIPPTVASLNSRMLSTDSTQPVDARHNSLSPNDNMNNSAQNEDSAVSNAELLLNSMNSLYSMNDELDQSNTRNSNITSNDNVRSSANQDANDNATIRINISLDNDSNDSNDGNDSDDSNDTDDNSDTDDSNDNNNPYNGNNETIDGNHSSGNDENIYNNQSTSIENTNNDSHSRDNNDSIDNSTNENVNIHNSSNDENIKNIQSSGNDNNGNIGNI